MSHLSPQALEAGLPDIRRSPTDHGRLELIVRRPSADERELVDEATLDQVEGLIGDTWRTRADAVGNSAERVDRQVTVMNARVAALVAADPDRRALAGDQLYVDYDISIDHLPAGSLLAVGSTVLEISEHPHTGCAKFSARFGTDALRFVNSPEGRQLRLRGVNTRVVVPGVVRVGDKVEKVEP
ncbi:MAG TPA: hypothetical protein VK277_02155 [Acidimicrobiales bacterium]|nr:hypothetical protein [Acidimicrobiales bacterium]